MTKRTAAALVACTLLLTACSSPSKDEAFCSALEDWSGLVEDGGTIMEELGNSMMVDDSADLPSPEELHGFGQDILDKSDQADEAMATIVANTTDSEVAEILDAGNDILLDLFRWMGDAAVEADDIEGFAETIYMEIDTMGESEAAFGALDDVAVDEYINARCENADSLFDNN